MKKCFECANKLIGRQVNYERDYWFAYFCYVMGQSPDEVIV